MIRNEETNALKGMFFGHGSVLLTLLVLASISLPALAHGPHPVEVAAHFLSLTEEQVAAVIDIEQALHESTAPIVQQIRERKKSLEELITSEDPDPNEIGTRVLSIQALEEEVAAIQQDAAAEIRGMLDTDQLVRLDAASEVRPLCHVVPALSVLHLI